jgi:putative transposase
MRKIALKTGEYYHIYNRGVDKRNIFSDQNDFLRFFQSMDEFNTPDPIGSIFENSFRKKLTSLGHPMSKSKLVEFVCYCVNPNHYHFILKQAQDGGIEKFMQKLGNGYTKYFNNKYKRSGVLLQGKFKSKHIGSNEYLLHLSSYVNLNNKVHKINDHPMSKSSWNEYFGTKKENFCTAKEIVLGQFENSKEYGEFAENSLAGILERKKTSKEIEALLIEETN